jgi:hypothetical protein
VTRREVDKLVGEVQVYIQFRKPSQESAHDWRNMGSANDQWGCDPKDAARHIVATTGILAKSDQGIDHGWAALTQ